ncbi:glutamine synthetase, partial [Streptomyces sp. OF1]|nr:glutamine synthetase [Streptomyces alkaliterrae]
CGAGAGAAGAPAGPPSLRSGPATPTPGRTPKTARVGQDAYDAAVTDRERLRSFERM